MVSVAYQNEGTILTSDSSHLYEHHEAWRAKSSSPPTSDGPEAGTLLPTLRCNSRPGLGTTPTETARVLPLSPPSSPSNVVDEHKETRGLRRQSEYDSPSNSWSSIEGVPSESSLPSSLMRFGHLDHKLFNRIKDQKQSPSPPQQTMAVEGGSSSASGSALAPLTDSPRGPLMAETFSCDHVGCTGVFQTKYILT